MKTLWLSQSDYIQKVLKCFNMENTKLASTPLQECTTLSTTKPEYIATSDATKEAIWLHRFSTNF